MNSNGIKTFTITSQPFYDEYNKCYKNILMVNVEPRGPIRRIVRRIKLPRLSPFQREGPCNPIPQCGLALQSFLGTGCCKFNSGYNLMTPDEIPDLISFLTANGYNVDTQITRMMFQGEVKSNNSKLICYLTYTGRK